MNKSVKISIYGLSDEFINDFVQGFYSSCSDWNYSVSRDFLPDLEIRYFSAYCGKIEEIIEKEPVKGFFALNIAHKNALPMLDLHEKRVIMDKDIGLQVTPLAEKYYTDATMALYASYMTHMDPETPYEFGLAIGTLMQLLLEVEEREEEAL